MTKKETSWRHTNYSRWLLTLFTWKIQQACFDLQSLWGAHIQLQNIIHPATPASHHHKVDCCLSHQYWAVRETNELHSAKSPCVICERAGAYGSCDLWGARSCQTVWWWFNSNLSCSVHAQLGRHVGWSDAWNPLSWLWDCKFCSYMPACLIGEYKLKRLESKSLLSSFWDLFCFQEAPAF